MLCSTCLESRTQLTEAYSELPLSSPRRTSFDGQRLLKPQALARRVAVAAVQQAYPGRRVLLYTGDDLTAEQLARNASEKFGVQLRGSLEVCCRQSSGRRM